MARANVARQHGDDFQARLFWLHAACLLDPQSPIRKVAYETGPKSFDDILIEYDPGAAPIDHEGCPLVRKHIQCKWHATAGSFGYADLIDPAFVNAERYSLLQRAHEAQRAHAPDGLGCRFEFVTNWRLRPDDQLQDLVRKESDVIDLRRLREGATDRSLMGQVRQLWREHLQVDDEALARVVRVLAIAESPESLASLRDRLDDRFAVVGMRRVPVSESSFLYDDLAAKLLAQGRIEFDRDSFRELCRRENLLVVPASAAPAPTIGVRSFMHPIDPLEERCDRMLNLVPYFDGRYIRDPSDWQRCIFPELSRFICGTAQSTDRLRLVMDAHVSLAFAVGTILNVKSGRQIEVEQRSPGRRFWSASDAPVDERWPGLEFRREAIKTGERDVAIAVGLTHDMAAAARSFVTAMLPAVGQILYCHPKGGPSHQSVRCGSHAWLLAESLVQQVRQLPSDERGRGVFHVFIAGPNAFAFFFGQQRQALGSVAVYEWDFDGERGGGYTLGLSLGN
jgi:hypothetical protein